MSAASIRDHTRTLNVNVGILGHVDSGKTSLAKALSTHLSTAALDKLPQSQQRGITLDLGFSAFYIEAKLFKDKNISNNYEYVQITLVDCPGHASLIRTIIGGSSIIDYMLLVIDSNKGIQTQTAECLVIGEILTNNLIVVLNKCDLIQNNPDKLVKLEKGLINTFKQTKFGANVPIVKVSANPNSSDSLLINNNTATNNVIKPDIQPLINKLTELITLPQRDQTNKNFLFSVDHCFSIKGQGTVLTGTVLSGSISVNDTIEIPQLKVTKKIKSMQMFKLPIEHITQGDRAGICVTQLDSKLVERGLICTPNSIPTYEKIIISCEKIRFFKQKIENKAKFHISIGHSTAMATVIFFKIPITNNNSNNNVSNSDSKSNDQVNGTSNNHYRAVDTFDFKTEYLASEELLPISNTTPAHTQFALLTFDKPILCPPHALIIGSKLDTDININQCRLAFNGKLLTGLADNTNNNTTTNTDKTASNSNINSNGNSNNNNNLPSQSDIHIYKLKQREGTIDRIVDEYTLIGKDLFQKGSDINLFIGLTVIIEPNTNNNTNSDNNNDSNIVIKGRIDSGFGKGGKFKVVFNDKLPNTVNNKAKIILKYKKYMFTSSNKKAFTQTGLV